MKNSRHRITFKILLTHKLNNIKADQQDTMILSIYSKKPSKKSILTIEKTNMNYIKKNFKKLK